METIPSEMLRGHVDTIILLSLLDCDKHTSQIKEEIESRVDGQFQLKQGTFYSCLQRIVGQGFVTEYRSTSSDGKRRKYYQLTEKGKAYIEDNKDKWLFSRNVIDTLIQVPQDDTPIDSVYSYEKNKQTQAEIISKQADEISELNEKIEKIESQIQENNKVKEEISTEVVTETATTEPEQIIEKDTKLTDLERFLAGDFDHLEQEEQIKEEIPQKSQQIKEETKVVSIQEVKEQSYERDLFTIYEENKKNDEVVKETVKTQEETPVITPIFTESKRDFDDINKQNQIDDYFNSEEPVSRDYKSVLSKLFPVQAEAVEQKKEPVYEPKTEEVSTYFEQPAYVEKEPEVIVTEAKRPSHKHIKQLQKSKVLSEKPEYVENKSDEKFDFSDLYALADSDGFKLRTSTARTNKDIGKIYANKLVASSSITFYLIMLVEVFILALTTRNVVNFGFKPYILFGICLAIFPITSFIIYLLDSKRKVNSLITFKSIISFIFVVVLNLILIVIVYAILINIDFTDARQLTLYVFYPLIFILNLPIYFFIKYLKLDNQKYFS